MTSLVFGKHQLEQKTGPLLCPLPVTSSQLSGGQLTLDEKMNVREVHGGVLLLQWCNTVSPMLPLYVFKCQGLVILRIHRS